MTHCENPLCGVLFPQSGLVINPRLFCSDQCKQQASLIRRVSALFDGLPDARMIEILKAKRESQLIGLLMTNADFDLF
jgi:hypothetical protein